jgi:hypothetical protein
MKMRASIVIPFFFALSACSGGDGGDQAGEAAAPATLPAGQWQARWEVTAMRQTDHAPKPAVAAKVGDQGNADLCVGKSEGEKPNPALFGGPGYDCTYRSSYIKDGVMNADLACTRAGVHGAIAMSMHGTYDSKSYQGTIEADSYLPGPGDFAMTRRIGGRLGASSCQPKYAEPMVGDFKGSTKSGG